jgi:hypothetical protein
MTDSDSGPPTEADRELVGVFIAIQLARTPDKFKQIEFAGDVTEFAGTATPSRAQVAQYLEHRHLGFPSDEVEVEAAWTFVNGVAAMFPEEAKTISRVENISLAMQSAIGNVLPVVLDLSWTVQRSRKPNLITSDRPISNWRKPGKLDQFEGVRIGTAEETRIPIGPRHLLILRKNGPRWSSEEVEPSRFYLANEDVADRCSTIVIASRHRKEYLERLSLAQHGPTLRFHIGPGTRRFPDVSEEPMGDVLHMWTPRR